MSTLNEDNHRPRRWLLAALLFLMVGGAYARAPGLGFLNYDDPKYVSANATVLRGITSHGLGWAFHGAHVGNYHPITWLSHMLDAQLFGEKPAGHHIINVVLHAANVLLLFALLRRATGATWASFAAAALFAVHPLRVQSVAWVSERKDVLSTALGLTSLWFYVRYAESRSTRHYLLTFVFFVLGLLAKPMLITWPAILLLLDYWPLRRFGATSVRRLLIEKIPLFAVSLAMAGVTMWAQRETVATIEAYSPATRVFNAINAYFAYIRLLFWPADLAIHYPYPKSFNLWSTLLTAAVIAAFSSVAFARRRQAPYLLVGWLWFLGTLIPVIGLVQVGSQALADRYTYVPHIGLIVAVVWMCAEALRTNPSLRPAFAAAFVLVVVVFAVRTIIETGYWRDSESVFRRAVAVTPCNSVAYSNLGRALMANQRVEEAVDSYRQAIECNPKNPEPHNNLGILYAAVGKLDLALEHYREALQLNPRLAVTYFNLGNALDKQGSSISAMDQYEQAVVLDPHFAEAWNNYGMVLAKLDDPQGSIAKFTRAVEADPDHASAHYNLGVMLEKIGRTADAAGHYRTALQIRPAYDKARQRLLRLEQR